MTLASVISNLARKVLSLMGRNKSTTKTCPDGSVVRSNQKCPIVTSGGTSGQTPLAPVNTSLPAISGTVQKGVSLTCSTGGWDDAPTAFAYQWKVAGVNAGTGSSYTIKAADIGLNVTCVVTASNLGGSVAATATGVGPVIDLAPVNTLAPAASGTATVGQTISVTTGTWTNSPTSYDYQWKRNGAVISGATSSTYVVVTADNGAGLTCAVTATNSGGSASATSNSIGPVGSIVSLYTTWFGVTDATTGWITLPLKSGCRRVWVGPGGSDVADGLSYANRKLTLDAGMLAYMTGHTPGDQLMLAGGTTYTDNGNHGRGLGDLSPSNDPMYPSAVLSYNAAAPTDSSQYGRLVGSAKPWVSINYVTDTLLPYFSMDGGTGSGYTVIQGIDFDGNDLDGSNIPFVGIHSYIGFQNCRFKTIRLILQAVSSGVPGSTTYATNVLVSKCSGWGQWASTGNMSWLYVEGIDNYVEEDIVGGHGGWRMSATRGGLQSTGSPNIFGHGRYFSPYNSNSSAVNAHSRRAVWFDNAADGDNCRAGMYREQTVIINDPIAGQNGGFSNTIADSPSGCIVTAKDGLVMGGNDIDDGTSLPRGGGFGNRNTLTGSGIDNYAFLDNPKFGTVNNSLISTTYDSGETINMQFALSRIRAYNYAATLRASGGTNPTGAHLSWNDVITDPAGGTAPGTACSTWGAAPTNYKTLAQLTTLMGFSSVLHGYNVMLSNPQVSWAQPWLTLGLPAMGLTPTWASVSPPDLSGLDVMAIYPTAAPTLSLPTGTATGTTTAAVGATTDRATGKLYYVITTSNTQPTKAQIRAGKTASGAASVAFGSQIVTSTGAKTASATGLTTATTYFVHLMHEDQYPVSLQSNIVTSASFTTS